MKLYWRHLNLADRRKIANCQIKTTAKYTAYTVLPQEQRRGSSVSNTAESHSHEPIALINIQIGTEVIDGDHHIFNK